METKRQKIRAFNKVNLLSWIISLEKDGFVVCSFKDCCFMAFDLEEMSDHYSSCILDPACFAFMCDKCSKGCDSSNKLLRHRILQHPNECSYEEIEDFCAKENQLLPSSKPDRALSKVMKRSWDVSLENRKYVICLVPTCFYITQSLEMMESHYLKHCIPQFWKTLLYACSSCPGRFESFDDLNTHSKVFHSKEIEKKAVTSTMCQYWMGMLSEFKWARCTTPDCSFIDCEIQALKAHYETCHVPSQGSSYKCEKCHGCLNGINKFLKHMTSVHKPSEPVSLGYMKSVYTGLPTSTSEQNSLTSENESTGNQHIEPISEGEMANETSLEEQNDTTASLEKSLKPSSIKKLKGNNVSITKIVKKPGENASSGVSNETDGKPYKTTIEKIAQKVMLNSRDATLVPVNIKIEDRSWTMQVPNPKVSAVELEKLNVPNFKTDFWKAVNSEMDDLLKETSLKASVRNKQYHDKCNQNQECSDKPSGCTVESDSNYSCEDEPPEDSSEENLSEVDLSVQNSSFTSHQQLPSSSIVNHTEDPPKQSNGVASNVPTVINEKCLENKINLDGFHDTERSNSTNKGNKSNADDMSKSNPHEKCNDSSNDGTSSSTDGVGKGNSNEVNKNSPCKVSEISLDEVSKDNSNEHPTSSPTTEVNQINSDQCQTSENPNEEALNNSHSNSAEVPEDIILHYAHEEEDHSENGDLDDEVENKKSNRKTKRKTPARSRKRKRGPNKNPPAPKRRRVRAKKTDYADEIEEEELLVTEIKTEVVDPSYDFPNNFQEGRSQKPKRKRQSKFSHLGEDYIIPPDLTSMTDYGHYNRAGDYSEYNDDYIPVRSRRGSDPENIVVPVDISLMEGSEALETEIIPPRRNRRSLPLSQASIKKQKSSAAADLLLTMGDRITASSTLLNPNLEVKCAVCSDVMTAMEYQNNHLIRHNFMCWLENEQPLPLDDYSVMSLLINRGKRKFPSYNLTCEKCGISKKSAMGFISHVQFCGKSVEESQNLKLPCPVCNKTFKPSCMDQHLILNHKVSSDQPITYSLEKAPPRSAAVRCLEMFESNLERPIKMEPDDTEIMYQECEDPNFVPPNVDYRALNSMWKEALGKDNIIFCPNSGCEFASAVLAEMKKHHKKCELNGAYQPFSCKVCHFKAQSRETLRAHIKAEHSHQLASTNTESVFSIPYLKIVEEELYSSFSWVRQTSFLRPAVHWTKDIRRSIYSEEPLFPALRVSVGNWDLLHDSEDYLHALSQSIYIKFESCDWTRLNLFGTLNDQGTSSVIWSGGPVWSLAWCPTPDDQLREQYLAVSSHLAPSLSYQIGTTYSHPATIQLWSYGLLVNNKKRDEEPMLSYSLCVDEGCIWDMEWCPSGCHDDRRLGLLAAAFSSGAIHIFSFPHPYQLPPTDLNVLMYKAPPVLKLQLPSSQNVQCKRVSWSKVKPHKIVVGGFVNGLVAVWDLSVSSSLLRHGCVLYPCRIFQPHYSTVTCLAMSPLSNDHLLTGSLDRTLKLWDLRDTTAPLQCVSKGCVTDAVWLTHWLCFVAGLDGGYINSASTGLFNSLRDFSFLPASILNSITTTVMSISSCDWLNCTAFSFEDGYVAAVFGIRQMGDGTEATKRRAKYIVKSELSTIPADGPSKKKTAKDKDKDKAKGKDNNKEKDGKLENLVPKNSSSYEESATLFGVHISLSKNIDDNFKPMKSDEDIRHDIYSIQSANKVCFNPNAQSFLSFAVGYESGFVIVPNLILPSSNNALINEVLPKKKE